MIDPLLKDKIEDHTTYWVNKANSLLDVQIPSPEIDYTQRGTVAAQTFTYSDAEGAIVKTRISFNPYYIVQDSQEFIETIVPHEVAHLAQNIMHPNSKPHGIEWIQIMKQFGVKPEIYTDVHVHMPPSQAKRLHLYRCLDCLKPKVFGQKKHGAFEGKLKLPECPECKGVMEYVRSTDL